MKLPITLLAALGAAASAHAQIVYTQNFEAPVGAEWSNTTTSVTPIGARAFLGEFGNQTVSLDLTGLPAHGQVTISFDLFAIRTWDGNGTGPGDEDNFIVRLGDGVTQTDALNTTFSNENNPLGTLFQAYPDSLASALTHPQKTGADEINSLGYTFGGDPTDTVYNLSFTVAHTSTDFRADFQGILNQAIGDESWGLDNVTVSVSAVPEPGEYAAVFGLGLAGVAAWRRRAREQAGNVQAA